MVDYNEPELRKKLLRVYNRFVENPTDKTNLEEIKRLDNEYESLGAVNDYLASQPISKEMGNAIGYLSNLWLNEFNLSRKEIKSEAKKILEELRKS